MPLFLAASAAVTTTLVLAYLGVTQQIGAHPIWALQTAWIGAGVGVAVAGLAYWRRIPRTPAAIALAVACCAALGLAVYGKSAFAASFGEDRSAGAFWYYGWIGTAAVFTAAVTTLLRRKRAIISE